MGELQDIAAHDGLQAEIANLQAFPDVLAAAAAGAAEENIPLRQVSSSRTRDMTRTRIFWKPNARADENRGLPSDEGFRVEATTLSMLFMQAVRVLHPGRNHSDRLTIPSSLSDLSSRSLRPPFASRTASLLWKPVTLPWLSPTWVGTQPLVKTPAIRPQRATYAFVWYVLSLFSVPYRHLTINPQVVLSLLLFLLPGRGGRLHN